MKKVIFINSHPIQYFAPMYKYMNEHGMNVEAWYASDNSVGGGIDKEFGVKVKWDIPILEGYSYRFFKNSSRKPHTSSGFLGLVNFGMIAEIFRIPPSIIVVHGWHYFTHFFILLLAKFRGHVVCIRSEVPLSHENLKSGWKQRLKKLGLKYILFPRVDYFLFIGSQNRLFFKSYGIADKRLIYCPYAVDNERFGRAIYDVNRIKSELNIPLDAKVILFSAKYINKKRPLDLLKAFQLLNNQQCWLIMVGEGELRKEMEEFIANNKLNNVQLTGFVNQSLIPSYYAISDLFVMCSSLGETWGLSVNEAMNFNLPVVISDLTGCSDDLVVEGVNGYKFETGNVEDLVTKLHQVLVDKKLSWETSSKKIIEKFSYSTIVDNLKLIA